MGGNKPFDLFDIPLEDRYPGGRDGGIDYDPSPAEALRRQLLEAKTFDAYLTNLQAELDSYGDLVELPPDWEASMQTLNNYLAFNEIDWTEIHPREIAIAYIAIVRGQIPDADVFLDQAEVALSAYQLQKVLPKKLLDELNQVADPKNRVLCSYCWRTVYSPFLLRLEDAREHPNEGPLYNFQSPDALYNPDPLSSTLGS